MTGGGREGEAEHLPIDASLLDPLTGLYSQPFFLAMVDQRVTACRRMLRPVAVALFEVVEGLPEGPVQPIDPRIVAKVAKATIRAADLCARLSDGSYGLLLEDTPEDGAIWAVERLRRALGTKPGGRTLRAGIGCYPGHALVATDMIAGAAAALTVARSWTQDRIEVAVA
jgi:GGDEF domain-containing protein